MREGNLHRPKGQSFTKSRHDLSNEYVQYGLQNDPSFG